MLDENSRDARNSGAGSLVRADGIVGAVRQPGRARRLVVRDLLHELNCTSILQIGSYASRSEGMAAGCLGKACAARAAQVAAAFAAARDAGDVGAGAVDGRGAVREVAGGDFLGSNDAC